MRGRSSPEAAGAFSFSGVLAPGSELCDCAFLLFMSLLKAVLYVREFHSFGFKEDQHVVK
jgi:hypothetical protein